MVVDEGWRSGSISAEISARITENAFYDLDAPVGRVCSAEVPIPYAKHLELAAPAVGGAGSRAAARERSAPVAEFLMPSLGADMEHGKIVEWLVKPGDYVRRGDLVAVVDTDKTVMDVESFQEGVVAELLVDIGETVPIGTPLARIPDPGRGGPRAMRRRPGPCRARHPAGRGARRRPPGAAPAEAPRQSSPDRAAGAASGAPAGRRHRTIHGTGKGGAITRADVEHAVAARPDRESTCRWCTGRVQTGASSGATWRRLRRGLRRQSWGLSRRPR